MRASATRSKRQPPTVPVQSPGPRGEAAPGHFADLLAAVQVHNVGRRKGERTRDRLRLAAVQTLEQRGYLQLRVADICKKAKVSPAVFYLYYPNKEAITVEVLSEFLRHTFRVDEVPVAPRPRRALFDSLVAKNLAWIKGIRSNAGLARCLLQLADQVPGFKLLVSESNYHWAALVTERLMRRHPSVTVDRNALLLAVYAVSGMVDDLCSRLLVSRDERIVAVVGAVVPDDEALAEFVSLLWYRALFGADPPKLRHDASRRLLALTDIPASESGID